MMKPPESPLEVALRVFLVTTPQAGRSLAALHEYLAPSRTQAEAIARLTRADSLAAARTLVRRWRDQQLDAGVQAPVVASRVRHVNQLMEFLNAQGLVIWAPAVDVKMRTGEAP